jgi:hypothetical protein
MRRSDAELSFAHSLSTGEKKKKKKEQGKRMWRPMRTRSAARRIQMFTPQINCSSEKIGTARAKYNYNHVVNGCYSIASKPLM